ncbi:MAG: oxidoreductase [Candidatus Glassbacteria bacterium]|nr:oxidoreductase [Candidatus Glassbacteria bacterium]
MLSEAGHGGQPGKERARVEAKTVHRVQSVRHLTDSAFILRVDRHGLPAVAGQCATVGAAGSGVNREYSLYSGDHDPFFEFLVKEVEEGQVSPALKKCVPGDPVELDGPYGRFVVQAPDDRSRRYLFVATGVGIAPFHGFAGSYPGLDYLLLHGVRRLAERYEKEFYPPGRYIACVSGEPGGDFSGRATDYLRSHPVDPQTYCYLCGNSAMVAEAYEILRAQGLGGDRLFTEVFF